MPPSSPTFNTPFAMFFLSSEGLPHGGWVDAVEQDGPGRRHDLLEGQAGRAHPTGERGGDEGVLDLDEARARTDVDDLHVGHCSPPCSPARSCCAPRTFGNLVGAHR